MNTFHPFKDDEPEDDQNYYDNQDMLENYGVEINNGMNNQPLDTRMLPPDDDTISNVDLLNLENQEGAYQSKPKSRGRYEGQQETANFHGKRKQWTQKSPNSKNFEEDEHRYGDRLFEKGRQILESHDVDDRIPEANMIPDVSQLHEDEFMNSDYGDKTQSPQPNYSHAKQKSKFADLLETHNVFFQNIDKKGFRPEHVGDIDTVEYE